MSQIDVKNAKVALAHRLRMWECPGDVSQLAAGFIDDLVAKGWQMAPYLETRPVPPRPADCCTRCAQVLTDTCCDQPTARPVSGARRPDDFHPTTPAATEGDTP